MIIIVIMITIIIMTIFCNISALDRRLVDHAWLFFVLIQIGLLLFVTIVWLPMTCVWWGLLLGWVALDPDAFTYEYCSTLDGFLKHLHRDNFELLFERFSQSPFLDGVAEIHKGDSKYGKFTILPPQVLLLLFRELAKTIANNYSWSKLIPITS